MMTDAIPADVWVWEYSTPDGRIVHATEFPTRDDLDRAVGDCFTDYTWEDVERRGIRGSAIFMSHYGRHEDTGHWVYRKQANTATFPGAPGSRWRDADGDMWMLGDDGFMRMTRKRTAPDEVAKTFGPMTRVGGQS